MMYFWRFVGVLILVVLFLAPVVRSHLQEFAIVQDVSSIELDYSLLGLEGFRKRLDEVVRRNGLDPRHAAIQVKENRQESKVLIDIRYSSPVSFFFSWTRDVVIQRQMLLRPVE